MAKKDIHPKTGISISNPDDTFSLNYEIRTAFGWGGLITIYYGDFLKNHLTYLKETDEEYLKIRSSYIHSIQREIITDDNFEFAPHGLLRIKILYSDKANAAEYKSAILFEGALTKAKAKMLVLEGL